MAKVKKTPLKERGTYKYYDTNGKVVDELKPGVNGVTEMDIYQLHQLDDQDVYYTMKAHQGLRTNKEKAEIRDWIPTFVEKFKTEHNGIEPTDDVVKDAVKEQFPMVQTFSINAFEAEGHADDKNDFYYQVCLEDKSKNASDSRLERLEELIPELTENQRWLIQKIFHEEVSQTDVAEELGITKQAVQNRLNKIYTRIKKLF